MYLPPHFDCKDRSLACELMRAHPLASLVSNDDAGVPFISHLPLHVEERGDRLVLLGHCAKPNPHWRYLLERPTAVVAFLGPQAYQSPTIYPDRLRVPSWNYVAVHCTVQAQLLAEPLEKDRLLKHLIGDHEPAYVQQWIDLGTDFQHKMLAGIVAFELTVTQWQCKLKVNQHRPEAYEGMRAAYATGDANAQALLPWMDKLGMGAKPH